MSTRHGFWFGLALGLFFAFGFMAANALTPTAEAQSARRFEYLSIHHGWDDGRWAAEAGRRGWRFVGFEYGNSHILIFERPL